MTHADRLRMMADPGPTDWCDEDRAACLSGARAIEHLDELLKAAKFVASFAKSWEPLSPGDIRELTEAIAKAEAAGFARAFFEVNP